MSPLTWVVLILKLNSSNHCRSFWTNAKVPKPCRGGLVSFRHKQVFCAFCNQLFVRKLTKRLEDLTHDSGALKSHLLPQLKALNNLVPELVNFGISVRIRWFR